MPDTPFEEHRHTAPDVMTGTIALCLVDGDRGWRMPVDRELWETVDEDTREDFRNRLREQAERRGATRPLPVEVIYPPE